MHRDKLESSTEREREGRRKKKKGRSGRERREMFGNKGNPDDVPVKVGKKPPVF